LVASIFNIAKGIPLLPLQTLWVSFTMLSIQSVGLGYSKPAAGLMDRPPLPPTKPILTRGLIVWLAFVGLVMTVGTLSVISWAEHEHGLAIARTMGMVTFALFLLFFSIESKDQAGLGVLPRHLLRQDVRHHDQRVLRPADPVHRPGASSRP
jgi:Ca2+-transporting ATPase